MYVFWVKGEFMNVNNAWERIQQKNEVFQSLQNCSLFHVINEKWTITTAEVLV